MKGILDTKSKTLTLDSSINFSDLKRLIEYILPGYETANHFTLNITSIKDSKDAILVKMPIKTDWKYDPKFIWLEYKGTENIKIEDGSITDRCSKEATFLVGGTYNLNIEL